MGITTICGLALVIASTAFFLKKTIPDYSLPFTVCCTIVLTGVALSSVKSELDLLSALTENVINQEYINIIMKTFGITLTVQTASDICKDSGENAIASKLELIGKTEIIILSIPLIKRILEITKDLMM